VEQKEEAVIIINIGEEGLHVQDDEKGLAVHVEKDLSCVVTKLDEEIVVDAVNVSDMIDAAELIKGVLVERYGGYR
jgi:hypothetical protein